MAERHRLVGVRGDSQRVAGAGQLFEAEHAVAGFDFDAADSFAGSGEDWNVVDAEVNQAGFASDDEDRVGIADQFDGDDSVAGDDAAELAAVLVRRGAERAERQAQHIAERRHDEQVRAGQGVFLLLHVFRSEAGIGRQRGDDADPVLQFDVFADRFAVAAAGGDLVDRQRVGDAIAGEEDDRVQRAAGDDVEDAVSFADASSLDLRQPADALDPAFASQHDVRVLFDDVRGGVELGDLFRGTDRRFPLVRELREQLFEFAANDAPQARFGFQQLAESFGFGLFFIQLFADVVDLQLADPIQHHFENRHRLNFVERELLHQLGGGVLFAVAAADDFDGSVEAVEDDREAFQDVDAAFELSQQILEPAADCLQAEVEEVFQHLDQIAARRSQRARFGRHETGRVVGEVRFERAVLVEVRHDHFGIGVLFEFEHDPQAKFFIRLVVEFEDLREIAAVDDVAEFGH